MAAGLTDWRDILILVLYFVFVLVVGLVASCRKGRETVKGYFLAGRTMVWLPIGFSLFASNIGSEHFIGLAGSGASSGIAVVAFEWGAVLLLLLLGWVFLPVYLTSGIYTMPEYLGRRFGGTRIRLYLSLIATLLYIATKISVDVYAGALFIQQALAWNTYISIVGILVITGAYTIIGGLTAVIFTDTLQTIIMLTGSVILAVIAYMKVGGLLALEYKYMAAIPSTYNVTSNLSKCGLPRDDAFHILRDPLNSDLPWPGLIIRSTVASLWYWCADQVIVQRTLAAKNIAHARGATITAGYLKFLPLFLIILPGMISRVLYVDEVACMDPDTCKRVCDNAAGCSNIAYPKLVLELAPVGLRGLMMAVMMSALMSSLTSVFNSAATLFTLDVWKRFRPAASEREQLITGRIYVVVLVGLSVLWIPLIRSAQGAQLFLYIQAVTGYIAPPVCSVFLLAVFIPRVNEKGAFWGILIGQAAGITRLVLDFIYPAPGCGEVDIRPDVVAKVHFTYFAAILLVLTTLVALIISIATEKPDPKLLKNLTFWSVQRSFKKENRITVRVRSILGPPGPPADEEKAHVEATSVEKRASRMSATSREIYKEHTQSSADDPEFQARQRRRELREKMRISPFWAGFLNLNAVLLICVFVVCYAIFA